MSWFFGLLNLLILKGVIASFFSNSESTTNWIFYLLIPILNLLFWFRFFWFSVYCSVNFGRHFWFSLSLYLEMKMLNSLSHILVIWVFHSFSLVLVDEKSLHFCQLLVITFSQTAVTNIYFGSYFICSLQTKIVINSSLFRPNQLSLWEIWIKDWIWKNWN